MTEFKQTSLSNTTPTPDLINRQVIVVKEGVNAYAEDIGYIGTIKSVCLGFGGVFVFLIEFPFNHRNRRSFHDGGNLKDLFTKEYAQTKSGNSWYFHAEELDLIERNNKPFTDQEYEELLV